MTDRRVWLFDIDGTLLSTDGAAREAFSRALGEVFGVDDDLGGIAFAGRTDPLILGDVLARHGLGPGPAERERFWRSTYAHMAALLRPERGRVLPGVEPLLARVAAEPAWTAALLTGNNAEMARVKLGHFGLERWFAFGAFGDEAPDRDRLARVAVARAAERLGAAPWQCVVIGDTEHDIACARAAGAWAVAVATGTVSAAALEARRPDLLLADLSEPERLLAFVRDLPAFPD